MATKQVRVCDIFGTHEARTVRAIVQVPSDDDGGREPGHIFASDLTDMSERAQKRLISFIERDLRPPSKKAVPDE